MTADLKATATILSSSLRRSAALKTAFAWIHACGHCKRQVRGCSSSPRAHNMNRVGGLGIHLCFCQRHVGQKLRQAKRIRGSMGCPVFAIRGRACQLLVWQTCDATNAMLPSAPPVRKSRAIKAVNDKLCALLPTRSETAVIDHVDLAERHELLHCFE